MEKQLLDAPLIPDIAKPQSSEEVAKAEPELLKRFEYEDSFELAKREGRYEDAAEILKNAADEDKIAKAQVEVGLYYLRGACTFKKDDIKASYYFRLSAEQGWERGMYQYGKTLINQQKTRKEGMEWIGKAFAGNDEYVKGRCYYHAYTVKCDLDLAAHHFRQAWEIQGQIDSERLYGFCFEMGEGMEKNVETAFQHYLNVANCGDAICQSLVAGMYASGIGCTKNRTRAWWYYRQGHIQSYVSSERMLERYGMFEVYDRVRNVVMCLISIRRYRKDECDPLGWLPNEIVVLIAKALWETRSDTVWMTEEERTAAKESKKWPKIPKVPLKHRLYM